MTLEEALMTLKGFEAWRNGGARIMKAHITKPAIARVFYSFLF